MKVLDGAKPKDAKILAMWLTLQLPVQYMYAGSQMWLLWDKQYDAEDIAWAAGGTMNFHFRLKPQGNTDVDPA